MNFLETLIKSIEKFGDYIFGFLGYMLELCYELLEDGQIAVFVLLVLLLLKLIKRLT